MTYLKRGIARTPCIASNCFSRTGPGPIRAKDSSSSVDCLLISPRGNGPNYRVPRVTRKGEVQQRLQAKTKASKIDTCIRDFRVTNCMSCHVRHLRNRPLVRKLTWIPQLESTLLPIDLLLLTERCGHHQDSEIIEDYWKTLEPIEMTKG